MPPLRPRNPVTGQDPASRKRLARDFGDRLRLLRTHRGLTRKEFERRFDVTGIAELELARREPRLADILAICSGMKTTPNVLLGGLYDRPKKRKARATGQDHEK